MGLYAGHVQCRHYYGFKIIIGGLKNVIALYVRSDKGRKAYYFKAPKNIDDILAKFDKLEEVANK